MRSTNARAKIDLLLRGLEALRWSKEGIFNIDEESRMKDSHGIGHWARIEYIRISLLLRSALKLNISFLTHVRLRLFRPK